MTAGTAMVAIEYFGFLMSTFYGILGTVVLAILFSIILLGVVVVRFFTEKEFNRIRFQTSICHLLSIEIEVEK